MSCPRAMGEFGTLGWHLRAGGRQSTRMAWSCRDSSDQGGTYGRPDLIPAEGRVSEGETTPLGARVRVGALGGEEPEGEGRSRMEPFTRPGARRRRCPRQRAEYRGRARVPAHASKGSFDNGGQSAHVCGSVGAQATTATCWDEASVATAGLGARERLVWLPLRNSATAGPGPRCRLPSGSRPKENARP